MANSTLVSVTLDVGLNTIALVAKRTITIDAVMTGLAGEGSGQRCKIVKGFIDWYESVAGVDEVGIGDASCTEVPIRAVKALVTNTIDVLFLHQQLFHGKSGNEHTLSHPSQIAL